MMKIKDRVKVISQASALLKQNLPSSVFEGKLDSIADGKLVMTDENGKKCSHVVAKDTTISCDGKPCKAEALEAGSKIRVTTKKTNRSEAIAIEALAKNAEFSSCCA